MEFQKVIIHLAWRRQFSTTDVYLPPNRSNYSYSHQDDQSWLDHLPKEPGFVCWDFNAHHSYLDDLVCTDPRVSARHDRMEPYSKVVLNDGSPTRAVRGDQSAGISTISTISTIITISTPNVWMVDAAMDDRFSWVTIP